MRSGRRRPTGPAGRPARLRSLGTGPAGTHVGTPLYIRQVDDLSEARRSQTGRNRVHRRSTRLRASEVDEAALDVRVHQLHADPIADIEAALAAHHPPFDRRVAGCAPRSPSPRHPSRCASKRWPRRGASSSAAADLRTWRSTFVALSSCNVQCRARSVSCSVGVRTGRFRRSRPSASRCVAEVGEAAVRRRRVRVVLHGEAEVSVGASPPGSSTAYSPRARAASRRRATRRGTARVRPAPRARGTAAARGARLGGQPLAEAGRELDDAVPPLGGAQHAPQRRKAVALEEQRRRDVGRDHEVLDELLGRGSSRPAEVGEERRRRRRRSSPSSRGSGRPLCGAGAFMARATPLLQAQLVGNRGRSTPSDAGASRRAVEPRGDASRRRASPGCARAHGRRRNRAPLRRETPSSRRPRSRAGRRASPSDVRSVDSLSGSIGKVSAAVYTEVVFVAGVARRSRSPPRRSRRRRRRRRSSFTAPSWRGSATVSWSRSRESSLSIDTHASFRRSRTAEPTSSTWSPRASTSASTAVEKSGSRPRSVIAPAGDRAQRLTSGRGVPAHFLLRFAPAVRTSRAGDGQGLSDRRARSEAWVTSSTGTTGLETCWSKPAARACSRCAGPA